jgi:hypothetical protein
VEAGDFTVAHTHLSIHDPQMKRTGLERLRNPLAAQGLRNAFPSLSPGFSRALGKTLTQPG